ncbi:hypothetical protein ACS0TY_022991 [Phlomoides rotata]
MSTKNPHHQGNLTLEFKVHGKEKKIAPKDLTIVWGDDDRFWNVPDDEESPAVLHQVCWLEVRGCVRNVKPDKEYEVGFNISLTPDAFGWGSSKVFILVKRGQNGKFKPTKFDLESSIIKENTNIRVKVPAADVEKTGQNSDDLELHFGMFEVWSGKWKGGLKIHYAFVRQSDHVSP